MLWRMEKASSRGDYGQLLVSPQGYSQMAPEGTQEVNGVKTWEGQRWASRLVKGAGRGEESGSRRRPERPTQAVCDISRYKGQVWVLGKE